MDGSCASAVARPRCSIGVVLGGGGGSDDVGGAALPSVLSCVGARSKLISAAKSVLVFKSGSSVSMEAASVISSSTPSLGYVAQDEGKTTERLIVLLLLVVLTPSSSPPLLLLLALLLPPQPSSSLPPSSLLFHRLVNHRVFAAV